MAQVAFRLKFSCVGVRESLWLQIIGCASGSRLRTMKRPPLVLLALAAWAYMMVRMCQRHNLMVPGVAAAVALGVCGSVILKRYLLAPADAPEELEPAKKID